MSAGTSEYLTFQLDNELFALDIDKVREVLELSAITRVPRTPDYVRGVINLRGNIVPVVDLKLKLGLSKTEKTIDTCVVITEVAIGGERVVIGALADSVQEVLGLDAAQIAPPPRVGMRIDEACIRGMGKREDRFVIVLDVDRVLAGADLRGVKSPGPASEAEPASLPGAEPPTASG